MQFDKRNKRAAFYHAAIAAGKNGIYVVQGVGSSTTKFAAAFRSVLGVTPSEYRRLDG